MIRTPALLAALLVTATSFGCGGSSISDPSLLTLENAPARVEIAGRDLELETYLWRDFQPISPPDGKPLIAVLRVRTVDGARLPAGIRADQVSVSFSGDVWTAPVKQELPGERPDVMEVVARGGPKWGPGVKVDVVVRLRDVQGRAHWLRAADQPIHRTD